jgi:hypothetical protein
MARDLGSLTVPARHAARPAIMGAEPAVIPPEAHGTPDPRAEEAVESARSTALLVKRGVMTAGDQARPAQPPEGTRPRRSWGTLQERGVALPMTPWPA